MGAFMDFNKKFFDPLGLVFKPKQEEPVDNSPTKDWKSGVTETGTDRAPGSASLRARRQNLPGGSYGSALRTR